MSIYRRAAKSDTSRADIVEGLRAHGVHVWDMRWPCDLLCWHARFGAGNFKTLEIKTAYGKRNPKPRIDKRQKAQEDFLRLTETPVVTDLEGSLRALGLIGPSQSVSCTSKLHSVATSSAAVR